jgi:uncharacterized protein YuzB (UPF0349 family)
MTNDSINLGRTAATSLGASAAATTVAVYGCAAFVGTCATCTLAVVAAPVVGAVFAAKIFSWFFEE